MKRWKKVFRTNRGDKKAEVTILISDEINFNTNTIKKDKGRHYIIMKGSVHGKHNTIINIYVPNIEAPKYIKQILTDIK